MELKLDKNIDSICLYGRKVDKLLGGGAVGDHRKPDRNLTANKVNGVYT